MPHWAAAMLTLPRLSLATTCYIAAVLARCPVDLLMPSRRRPHGLQDLERLPRAVVPGEQLGSLQRPGGILLTHRIVHHEAADRATDARGIVRITIDGRVAPDLGQSAGPGSDDRAAARHRLELGKSERTRRSKGALNSSQNCTADHQIGLRDKAE